PRPHNRGSGFRNRGGGRPWLAIDLEHTPKAASANGNYRRSEEKSLEAVVISDSPIVSIAEEAAGSNRTPFRHASAVPNDAGPASLEMLDRLNSPNSAQRAAALADLADLGGDEAFRLITKSFDDPASEVRNAAARALYGMSEDHAGLFTSALREAAPERRRKIGAAIAGSGLA